MNAPKRAKQKPSMAAPVATGLAPAPLGWQERIGILLRHLLPMTLVLALGHSTGQFLLLSMLNLSMNIAILGTVGVAVSMRDQYVSRYDRLAGLATLFVIGIGLTALLAALFGWPMALAIAELDDIAYEPSLTWSAALMLLVGVFQATQKYGTDVRKPRPESVRMHEDRPLIIAWVLSAGLLFLIAPYFFEFGSVGLVLLMVLLTALSVLRDCYPEKILQLTRNIAPPPSK